MKIEETIIEFYPWQYATIRHALLKKKVAFTLYANGDKAVIYRSSKVVKRALSHIAAEWAIVEK